MMENREWKAGIDIDLSASSSERYQDNGHFSPCSKDWLGSIDENK